MAFESVTSVESLSVHFLEETGKLGVWFAGGLMMRSLHMRGSLLWWGECDGQLQVMEEEEEEVGSGWGCGEARLGY